MPNPPQINGVVNFWFFIPKNIIIPPPSPRKIVNIPKITDSASTPEVNGVNIPHKRAVMEIT